MLRYTCQTAIFYLFKDHQMNLFKLISTLLLSLCLMACDDDAQKIVVDAMVDAGPECVPNPEGTTLCIQRYGERFFCNVEGSCQELAACETESCCIPGEMGNGYCLETYGPGSTCEFNDNQGECTARACVDCTPDSDGHTCCYDALGSGWFCGEGGAVPITDCDDDDCCVPGPGGDAKCARIFGMGSSCTQLGASGQCNRASPPPCAGCQPMTEGHQCCSSEFGDSWFCGLEGICRPASGCLEQDCCVPGASGDAQCTERFGAGSVCSVVTDDGRCSSPEGQ